MAKKKGRPTWFKMPDNLKELFDAVPDAPLAKAIRESQKYLRDQKANEDDMDDLEKAVFSAIKPYIDEAFADYQRSVEKGKEGSEKRYGKQGSPPIPPL